MAAEKKPQKHFKSPVIASRQDKGIREMAPLAPFIVSGGKNTERYYFNIYHPYLHNIHLKSALVSLVKSQNIQKNFL